MVDTDVENLLKLYLAARDRLLDTIINYHGVGTKVYANTILKQLEIEIKKLEKASTVFANTKISKEYQAGLNEVYSYFKKNNLMMSPPSMFATLHNDIIYDLAREMQYQIGQGLEQVGRQVLRYVEAAQDNALRQAGLFATGEKFASGATAKQMQESLVQMIKDEGFMTVQYGSGPKARQVSIDAYARMVSRSTTREAGNYAREIQLKTNGYDLVRFTEHYPTCAICAMYQGRVFSISGEDKRFPPLEDAFKSEYRNIHPNCRHVLVPVVEALAKPEEMAKWLEDSKKPYEDPRSNEEKTAYKAIEDKNRVVRNNRYQYERYKQVLGADAPKNFSQFMRLKNEDGEKWGFTQLDYQRRNKLMNNPSLGLPHANAATANDSKFVEYLFNPQSIDGWPKGQDIIDRLGYNIDNWQQLREAILTKAPQYPVSPKGLDQYGQRYEQNIIISGIKKNPVNMRVAWIEKDGETWMTSAYIKGIKKGK